MTFEQPSAATFAPTLSAPPSPTAPRSRRPIALVAATAVVAGVVGGGAGALAVSRTSGSIAGPSPLSTAQASVDGSVESVAKAVLPSTVQVQERAADGNGGGTGSGSIISADGYVLTNNHVVAGAADGGSLAVLFNDGRHAAAHIVGRDAGADVAVIKVDGVSGLTPIRVGSSADLEVGQPVVAVGSPLALAGTVTEGIVSALDRPVTTQGDGSETSVMNAIQTDSAINPGNSGGPLVNLRGELVGMNSAGASLGQSQGQQTGSIGLGFAIPVDQAMRIANELIRTGHSTRAVLGASATDAETGGALLQGVQQGSAAARAGLVQGDVVTKADGVAVPNAESLVAAIRTAAPGSAVELTLARAGAVRTVRVVLGTTQV